MNGQHQMKYRYRVTLENGQEVEVSSVFDGPKISAQIAELAAGRQMILLEELPEKDTYVRADLVTIVTHLKTPEAPLFAPTMPEPEPVEPPKTPPRKPPSRKG